MLRLLLSFFLVVALCSSCEEGSTLQGPPVVFTSFPSGKAVKWQQLLGSQLPLASDCDTQQVRVRVNPYTRLNLLTAAGTGDTLLLARVVRQRRLFSWIEHVGDSSYAVHAVRIRAHVVQGLRTNWQQMVYLDNAIKRGQDGPLLQSCSLQQGTQRLHFDLKALRSFYSAVVDSLPRYSILHTAVVASRQQPSSRPTISATANAPKPLSMYPNPAADQVTLDFARPGRWTAQLYTLDGRLLARQQVRASAVVLSLTHVSPGGYLVKVMEDSTGHSTTRRLLVQR